MKVSKECYDNYFNLISILHRLNIDHKIQLQMMTQWQEITVLDKLEAVYNQPIAIEYCIFTED